MSLPQKSLRFDRLDAFRGLAIVWMVAFHFCFDLNYFHFIHQNFSTAKVWTLQRTAIVFLFLFCSGASQGVALFYQQSTARFTRRWLQIAACALVVSLGSYVLFPRTFITFGVLHAMLLMLPLIRVGRHVGHWLWALGALAWCLPWWIKHAFFDSRWTNWLGFVTHKPFTEDYVPIFPWLGVALWGLALGQWLMKHHPTYLSGRLPQGLQILARLGRFPLTIYMVHQPILMGLLFWFK
jgi:uncharacterized membrane protein